MPRKTLFTLALLAAFLWAPDLTPHWKDYRLFDFPQAAANVLDFQPRRAATIDEEQDRLRPDPARLAAASVSAIHGPLDRFYGALAELERRQARQLRIVHYGDSPTTADLITADTRELLQKNFGDAGHGFHLIAKPWAWYEHRGVAADGGGWQIDPATQNQLKDGIYGLGGVSFRGAPGAWARYRFTRPPQTVELHYQPSAGGQLRFGDTLIDTGKGPGSVRLPGAAVMDLRVEAGSVRLFGFVAENGTPGVVYSSLGLNGAYISVLARMMNEQAWAAQLRHHDPDLVIVNYGTNESVYAKFVDTAFENELRETIRRIRVAVPDADILLMSPMDRGHRDSTGAISTVPALHRLVTIEQRVAAQLGVAFFNTFEAMGGPGTMGRWYEAEPRLVSADFIHPMPQGARIVGTLLYKALSDGYRRAKTRHMTERYARKAGS